MAKKRYTNDVHWYVEGKKLPITYSSVATSYAITVYADILNESGIPPTPNNLLAYFESERLVGLYEEKAILQKYVELGRGDIPMNLASGNLRVIGRNSALDKNSKVQ